MINLPEEIQKDISLIQQVSDDLKMKVLIVGGLPRDMVSGKGVTTDTDLDLTEENGNAFDLAFFVAAKYDLPEPEVYESSGTSLVTMQSGRKVEFHNAYYNVPHIIDQLYLLGVEPTPINKDVYARDFTINTLLIDPMTEEYLDITGKAMHDIKNRILRTPLDPRKTIAVNNPKVILRGIRFTIEMDLRPDPNYEAAVQEFIPQLIHFLQSHPHSQMVRETIRKTMAANSEKAIAEYRRLGILQYLPHEEGIDSVMKEEIFGTTISPTSSSDFQYVTAQTKMIQHLLEQREKHKAYMRRKSREDRLNHEKRRKIMERARSGFYLTNPETEYVKKGK